MAGVAIVCTLLIQALACAVTDFPQVNATFDEEAGEILRHRALVLLATRTLDREAREAIVEFVRKGGGLFIAASADTTKSRMSCSKRCSTAGGGSGGTEPAADGAV